MVAEKKENIRTDIKIVNTSLFMTDWYIDQMKTKHESDPCQFLLRMMSMEIN
jgi:hypothetical protein